MLISKRRQAHSERRGFTLVEMMIGLVITAFIIGAISTSLGLLARSKNGAKERLDATLRADAALREIRSDIVSMIRSDDLFHAQFYLIDNVRNTSIGRLDRDELIVFNTKLRPVRDIHYNGEGLEYETHYRIEDDSLGPVLWQRRDAVPDQNIFGGGRIRPLVEGIVSMNIEAYDGYNWHSEWRSDEQGLPRAVRVTILASGHRMGDDPYLDAPLMPLRTIIPIDRVTAPRDWLLPTEEELAELGLADVHGRPLPDLQSGDPNSDLDPEIVDTINRSGVTNMNEVNSARRPGQRPAAGQQPPPGNQNPPE